MLIRHLLHRYLRFAFASTTLALLSPIAADAQTTLGVGNCTSTLRMIVGQAPTGSAVCRVTAPTGVANFRVDNVPLFLTVTPQSGVTTAVGRDVVVTISNFGRNHLVPQVALTNLSFVATSGGLNPVSRQVFTEVLPDGPPPNDDFANALHIPASQPTVVSTNFTATTEVGETDFRSVWYTWTAPSTGEFIFDTAGSFTKANAELDTILTISVGTTLLTTVASNDDIGGRLVSRVVLPAVAGTTYRVRLATKSTTTTNGFGLYRLNIQPMPASRVAVSPQRPYSAFGLQNGFEDGGGRSYLVSNLSNTPVTISPTTTAAGYSFSPTSGTIPAGESARFRMEDNVAATAQVGTFLHSINWDAAGITRLRLAIGTLTPETTLFASVLPTARARRFGEPATAFATILNAGPILLQKWVEALNEQ